ncbi:MAG TPA: hypothetical protein V6C82_07330 [Chroococcales cyanobacterium]|jgi:predicted PurR-regulated permease PerM
MEEVKSPLLLGLFVVALLFIVIQGLHFSGSFLAPILLAFTLAIALDPFIRNLESRGISRGKAVFAFALILFSITLVLGGIFAVELRHLVQRIPAYR